MNTFGWFLWLKKEELKEFISFVWQSIAFILLGAAVIYGVSFIPFVYKQGPCLSLRCLFSAFCIITTSLIIFGIFVIVKSIVGFIKSNWEKARRLEQQMYKETGLFCDSCKTNVIHKPGMDGHVYRSCKCGNHVRGLNWRSIDGARPSTTNP